MYTRLFGATIVYPLQFIRKSDSVVVDPEDIDRELRVHFGDSPSSQYRGWYDSVGKKLSDGHDWAGVRQLLLGMERAVKDESFKYHYARLAAVVEYLAEHYDIRLTKEG